MYSGRPAAEFIGLRRGLAAEFGRPLLPCDISMQIYLSYCYYSTTLLYGRWFGLGKGPGKKSVCEKLRLGQKAVTSCAAMASCAVPTASAIEPKPSRRSRSTSPDLIWPTRPGPANTRAV